MIPLSGRLSGRASEPSRIRVDGDGGYGTFRGWMLRPLGFSRRCEFIGGRARSVGALAPPPGVAGSLLVSVSPLDSVFVSAK
jgi:hypothetical protein